MISKGYTGGWDRKESLHVFNVGAVSDAHAKNRFRLLESTVHFNYQVASAGGMVSTRARKLIGPCSRCLVLHSAITEQMILSRPGNRMVVP